MTTINISELLSEFSTLQTQQKQIDNRIDEVKILLGEYLHSLGIDSITLKDLNKNEFCIGYVNRKNRRTNYDLLEKLLDDDKFNLAVTLTESTFLSIKSTKNKNPKTEFYTKTAPSAVK